METAEKFRETKYEETIGEIIEWFNDNDDVFIDCIEELDGWNGYLGDDRYYNMDEIAELFCGTNPLELLQRAYWGYDEYGGKTSSFDPTKQYFRFSGYGNLVSADEKDYSDHLDSYLVEALADKRKHVSEIGYNEELSELFDKLESINDDIDEDEEEGE